MINFKLWLSSCKRKLKNWRVAKNCRSKLCMEGKPLWDQVIKTMLIIAPREPGFKLLSRGHLHYWPSKESCVSSRKSCTKSTFDWSLKSTVWCKKRKSRAFFREQRRSSKSLTSWRTVPRTKMALLVLSNTNRECSLCGISCTFLRSCCKKWLMFI